MTDTAIEPLTKRQVGRREGSLPLRVTGRLKRALDLMAYENATDNEAAVQTGMTVTAIRLALKRPHVRAYLREQVEVLRTREDPRNIHRLIEIRDAANNMPAVQAIREMRRNDGDELAASTVRHAPGVVIVIQNGNPADRAVTINAPDICTEKDQ